MTVIIIFPLYYTCRDNNLLAENTINVDLTKKKEILLSDLFDSVRYVRLETTDDVLIKNISSIRYANNCLYILDVSTKTLFSFDANTGKNLWKIQSIGQGPKEYLEPTDFCIDEKNNRLYLFCNMEKILEYDLSGNFIQEYNVRLKGVSIACGGDYLYIYVGNHPQWINNRWGESHFLTVYNKHDGLLKGLLPFDFNIKIGGTRIQQWPNAFYHYNDEMYFFSPYFYDIYSVKGNGVEIVHRFNFGKQNSQRHLITYSTEELRRTNYARGLHLCWENDMYLSVNTVSAGMFYHILYVKKESQLFVGDFYNDMDYCFPCYLGFVQATNDFVFGHVSAINLLKQCIQSEGKASTLKEKIKAEITEDDNPVIFFYYFKK